MAENLTTNKRPTAHLRTIHVKDDHSLISHEPRVGLFATYRGHATRPGNVILAALPKVSGPFSLDAPNQMWLYHPGAVTTARCVTNLRAFGPTRGRIHRRRTTRVAVPHGRAAAVRSGENFPGIRPTVETGEIL